MSGFVSGFGSPNEKDVRNMFEKISYRGPFNSEVFCSENAIMAQNYLQADSNGTREEQLAQSIPVTFSTDKATYRICYDGQMGNWPELAEKFDVQDGPYREERLLMKIYDQVGSKILDYLGDTIFSLVIYDGEDFFAARDLLGIKTLFYGFKDDNIYFGSELKTLTAITDDLHEFPPGHFMQKERDFFCYGKLPEVAPPTINTPLEEMTAEIRSIIEESIDNRVNFDHPIASLLSGGMDSSVIAYICSKKYKEKYGQDAKLMSFVIGVGESGDVQSARVMAELIDSDHRELIVDLDEVLEMLPDVIYYLESFDPSLVRSAVANYMISRYAKEQGIQVLLSGEGGDEVFCGYTYLKEFPSEQLVARQVECLQFLHNNASLRLDRMNLCHSIRVVAPLVSGKLLNYALTIPPEYKQKPEGDVKVEKWIFRKAYEGILPDSITKRLKQEFSQGSGSANPLQKHFEQAIPQAELDEVKKQFPFVRSKEELYYFKLFTDFFGKGQAVKTVGQWICL